MLYNLIITPIETIVEWIFIFMIHHFENFGVIGPIVGVSLAVNFLALPLYNIADTLQEKERKISKALEPRVKRIKKAFSGNEQFMMLSTYYRQNNYHPLYALRSALSIIIQVPFFIAAYHFLSNCELLKGASFWIFSDLGSPDGLLHIGNFPIHILPILMTVINLLSGAIYAKDAPMKEKVQIVAMAALFLVILYNSPSGLVIYWILNNLFSLAKNIVKKTNNPGLVLYVIVTMILLGAGIYLYKAQMSLKRLALLIFLICVSLLPIVIKLLKNKVKIGYAFDKKIDFSIMLTSSIALTLLCGVVLPSSIIATSPAEFSFLGNTDSPLSYIWFTFCVFAGFFLLWPLLIYKLFGEKVKKAEGLVLLFLFIIALLNAYWFTAPYGTLSSLLELTTPNVLIYNSKKSLILFASVFIAVGVGVFVIRKTKVAKFIPLVMLSVCIGEATLGVSKISSISKAYKVLAENKEETKNHFEIGNEFTLSKNAQNVLILFLDRGINTFVPKIFEEFPEIKKQFAGFTYFPNTLSYSNATVYGSPGMFGGYEYVPEEMNTRPEQLLRNKHNEALMIMPRIFSEAGYETTVLGFPFPNYTGGGDLSFAKDYPEIKISEIEGKYVSNYFIEKNMIDGASVDANCKNGFIDFITMQCLPSFTRYTFYLRVRRIPGTDTKSFTFFQELSGLYYLSQMTDFTSENKTFTFIQNNTTHNVSISLDEDFEKPAKHQIEDGSLQHYHANVAALKQLGKYFDFLRENDVYDNTRIIVVSDHGANGVKNGSYSGELMAYSALLMEKDFDSSGDIEVDNTFMTNADLLFVAKDGLEISDTNPYTNKKLVQNKENGANLYPVIVWNPMHFRNDNLFNLDKNRAWHVEGDIYNEENWIPLLDWEKQNGGAQ